MTNNYKIQPVILCGGSGTRLWPLSRSGFPKQFLSLNGNESLFQQAVQRLEGLGTESVNVVSKPIIVTGDEHRFLALEQLKEIKVQLGTALLEPVARNTAPALTLAAFAAIADGDDPILVVTPSDHAVTNVSVFKKVIGKALKCAENSAIVVLGITPERPDTGYGYIRVGNREEHSALEVKEFIEKPNSTNAKKYFDKSGYYWNAGIFIMRASVWLNALLAFRPDIYEATKLAWDNQKKDNTLNAIFIRPGAIQFSAIPEESIDYAVIEHCPGSVFDIFVLELNAGWSDLGSWDAVWDILKKDENGNACFGDVLTVDSSNSLVYSTSRLVGLVGVNNLSVIETPDAVLIADKMDSQGVRNIVEQLKASQRDERILHRKVYRPWGWYDSVDEGERFKIKRIRVNPGASLSLQKHNHRAEHWVVVSGVALITNGKKKLTLNENQSTYIPLGEVHRLANPGKNLLEIVEVQSGDYLGEDDIIRFKDNYGRIKK